MLNCWTGGVHAGGKVSCVLTGSAKVMWTVWEPYWPTSAVSELAAGRLTVTFAEVMPAGTCTQ